MAVWRILTERAIKNCNFVKKTVDSSWKPPRIISMNYRTKIEKIRFRYLKGEITLEQAKGEVEPMIVKMNEIGKKIAKEHGRRFTPFTFGYIFR